MKFGKTVCYLLLNPRGLLRKSRKRDITLSFPPLIPHSLQFDLLNYSLGLGLNFSHFVDNLPHHLLPVIIFFK
jgi:hypothetical protein